MTGEKSEEELLDSIRSEINEALSNLVGEEACAAQRERILAITKETLEKYHVGAPASYPKFEAQYDSENNVLCVQMLDALGRPVHYDTLANRLLVKTASGYLDYFTLEPYEPIELTFSIGVADEGEAT